MARFLTSSGSEWLYWRTAHSLYPIKENNNHKNVNQVAKKFKIRNSKETVNLKEKEMNYSRGNRQKQI
jgi:ABC-type multidrug transport system ATPase subunit